MTKEQQEALDLEAKTIVSIAFRNGPLESIHAGKICPHCSGNAKYSHITDKEMKKLIKYAVDWVFFLLVMKSYSPEALQKVAKINDAVYTQYWDTPMLPREWRKFITTVLEYQE